LYLTQALLYGIGAAAIYFPVITLTPLHFDVHRGLALGIVVSGAGFGGLGNAPLIRALISATGIRGALRWLGLINFVITFPIAFVIKSKDGRVGSTQLVNLRVARRKVFIFEVADLLESALMDRVSALSFTRRPISFLCSTRRSLRCLFAYSTETGALLIALSNGVNAVSRILMGFLADKVGRQNTMIVTLFLSGLTVLTLWLRETRITFLSFGWCF